MPDETLAVDLHGLALSSYHHLEQVIQIPLVGTRSSSKASPIWSYESLQCVSVVNMFLAFATLINEAFPQEISPNRSLSKKQLKS
jgi:hypothetical protein